MHDDAIRLERQLVLVRWFVAAFGAVQVGFAVRDRATEAAFALPLAVALVVGLTIGNLAISSSVRRASAASQIRSIGVVAFLLDARERSVGISSAQPPTTSSKPRKIGLRQKW